MNRSGSCGLREFDDTDAEVSATIIMLILAVENADSSLS